MSARDEILNRSDIRDRLKEVLIEVLDMHESGLYPSWNVLAYESGERPRNIDLSRVDLSKVKVYSNIDEVE